MSERNKGKVLGEVCACVCTNCSHHKESRARIVKQLWFSSNGDAYCYMHAHQSV